MPDDKNATESNRTDAATPIEDGKSEPDADQDEADDQDDTYDCGLILARDLPPVPDWARRPPKVGGETGGLFGQSHEQDD